MVMLVYKLILIGRVTDVVSSPVIDVRTQNALTIDTAYAVINS